jgi:hypothetical protein
MPISLPRGAGAGAWLVRRGWKSPVCGPERIGKCLTVGEPCSNGATKRSGPDRRSSRPRRAEQTRASPRAYPASTLPARVNRRALRQRRHNRLKRRRARRQFMTSRRRCRRPPHMTRATVIRGGPERVAAGATQSARPRPRVRSARSARRRRSAHHSRGMTNARGLAAGAFVERRPADPSSHP